VSARPRRWDADLIEHLTNRNCLIEVSAHLGDDDPHVRVVYDDLDGDTHEQRFTDEQAGMLSDIMRVFDWRGLREFGHALTVAAQALHEVIPGSRLQVAGHPGEEPEEPEQAFVRLTYSVGDRTRTHDISPQAAADWAEVLQAVDLRTLPGIIRALRDTGQALLDVGPDADVDEEEGE
jgi:hypothetical protein